MAYQNAKKTSTNYCIELTKTNDILDILAIHTKDSKYDHEPDKKSLRGRLDDIEGVDDVNYDGHFGNYIYLTLDANFDEYDTWKKIQDCVNNFLQEK